jgi:hypothetical protein
MKTKNNKALKTSLIIAGLLIILSNTPPAQFFLLEEYHYTNKDRSFNYTEFPGKALDFKVGQRRWERFKTQHPEKNHTLYRTFRIKPYQFWEWWQYIAHPKRFTLPYIPPA